MSEDAVHPVGARLQAARRLARLRPHLLGFAGVAAIAVTAAWPDAVTRAERAVLRQATLENLVYALVVLALALAAAERLPGWRRLRATAGAAVDAAPPLEAVAAVAAVAGAGWYALGRDRVLPQLFADELIHEQTARQILQHGNLAVHGYGLVTALLDAAAFRVTPGALAAFHAIQLLNVAVMATAALPAYLLARRAASRRGSLAVAALTVTVAWMPYSAYVTTEAVFYPIFLLAVLALVRALERPTLLHQLALAGMLLVAFETRTQAAALFGAVVLAVAVHGRSRGGVGAAFRAFLPTWLLWAAGVALLVAALALGAGSPFGAYQILVGQLSSTLHPRGLLLWTAVNLTSIGLGCGALALIAWPFGLATLLRRGGRDGESALGAASLAAFLALLATVVVLGESRYGTGSAGERNLFFVVPLVFAGAVAWLERGLPRPRGLTFAVAAAAVGLVLLVPPGSIGVGSDSRTFALWSQLARPSFPEKWQMVVAVAVAALVVARMRRGRPLALAAVLASLGVVAANAESPAQPRASVAAYEWVDAALPRGSSAILLYVGVPKRLACARTVRADEVARLAVYSEFFNLKVGEVVQAFGDNPARGLGSPYVAIAPDGIVRLDGRPLRASYLVLDARLDVVGRRLGELTAARAMPQATQPAALALWRVPGGIRLREPSRLLGERGLRGLYCR